MGVVSDLVKAMIYNRTSTSIIKKEKEMRFKLVGNECSSKAGLGNFPTRNHRFSG
jgi:hypothetical protein